MRRVQALRRRTALLAVPGFCLLAAGCGGDGSGDPPIPEPVAATAETAAPAPSALSPTRAPSENFDLSHWYLTLPSGKAVDNAQLNAGYAESEVFYTDRDSGGMVFRCPNLAGTTANSNYSRTELRELLDPSNGSYRDDSNNWRPEDGGRLKATLRVDRVSTTGEDQKLGRIIIGQIHGPDTEPARLYFQKAPDQARGRIYVAMETASGDTWWSPDVVGNRDGEGIALGERFSYEIHLSGRRLKLTILRKDGTLSNSLVRDIDSAYLGMNQYFKAGLYNQNNSGDRSDYAQVTFFALTQAHPG